MEVEKQKSTEDVLLGNYLNVMIQLSKQWKVMVKCVISCISSGFCNPKSLYTL